MNSVEQWLNLSKHRANEILKEVYGPALKPPIKIKEVITSYLADVKVMSLFDQHFPKGVSAFSKKDMTWGWIIAVNGGECIERQRFSAAHELGHIVLIPNEAPKVFCSDESEGWDEKVCDRFAGHILIPEELVKDIYKIEPFPYVEYIAKIFNVSRQVAEIQLKLMGLPYNKMAGRF